MEIIIYKGDGVFDAIEQWKKNNDNGIISEIMTYEYYSSFDFGQHDVYLSTPIRYKSWIGKLIFKWKIQLKKEK